jgi:hypothetical protein
MAKIDLTKLKTRDPLVCPLGQTARCLVGPYDKRRHGPPDYFTVVDKFAPPSMSGSEWAERLGFKVNYFEYKIGCITYEMLDCAWRAYIMEHITWA